MIRFTALLAVLGAALVGVASIGAAPSASRTLSGSVGPSETIVLKKGSSPRLVDHTRPLHARRQRPVVAAQPPSPRARQQGDHERLLDGNEEGRADPDPGRYTYVCDPHSRDMIGSFRVR